MDLTNIFPCLIAIGIIIIGLDYIKILRYILKEIA